MYSLFHSFIDSFILFSFFLSCSFSFHVIFLFVWLFLLITGIWLFPLHVWVRLFLFFLITLKYAYCLIHLCFLLIPRPLNCSSLCTFGSVYVFKCSFDSFLFFSWSPEIYLFFDSFLSFYWSLARRKPGDSGWKLRVDSKLPNCGACAQLETLNVT